jgi:CRISPR-associated protein Cas8b1/Cst1 subtype I-B
LLLHARVLFTITKWFHKNENYFRTEEILLNCFEVLLLANKKDKENENVFNLMKEAYDFGNSSVFPKIVIYFIKEKIEKGEKKVRKCSVPCYRGICKTSMITSPGG